MKKNTPNHVLEMSARFKDEFHIKIKQAENWQEHEWGQLHGYIQILVNVLGGRENFIRHLGTISIERTATGTSLGLAYKDRIKLNGDTSFSAWTIIHELAHVWDAKNEWRLSIAMESFTGGFTNKKLSALKRFIPSSWDAGKFGPQKKPGFYGRKPGCNAAGYFYGDTPSGSNWNFNRKEDFSESVAMYCGWGRDNELSKTAHGRIERYLLPNGKKDPLYRIADNWSDYKKFFYPQDGNYTKTKRWQFIHELIQDQIQIK
jgi:hypothetical protein